jgi:hypothetical protein
MSTYGSPAVGGREGLAGPNVETLLPQRRQAVGWPEIVFSIALNGTTRRRIPESAT